MLTRSVSTSLLYWVAAALTAALLGAYFLWSAGHNPVRGAAENVDDAAGIFTAEQRERIERYHAFLLLDHDIDYRVQTARNVGDINRYSVQRFAELGVGARSTTGRGLLLVVDPGQDRVRLEISQALEGVYVDAFAAYLEHRQMVPFFRNARVADGILATTELIITRAQSAKTNRGFGDEAWAAAASGAGASAPARLGAGPDESFRQGGGFPAGVSPEITLGRYLQAMRERNARPDLDIYSATTRSMLAQWVVTPAQMDNVARSTAACHAEPARIDETGKLAVIRYPVAERACAPWFFVSEDGRWRLDLSAMQKAIRFGRSNAWHFDRAVEHPYRFAFQDWRLDRHGYPRR